MEIVKDVCFARLGAKCLQKRIGEFAAGWVNALLQTMLSPPVFGPELLLEYKCFGQV